MPLKSVIIEDDINYALEIEMILDELDIEIVQTSKTWKSMVSKIRKLKPDIVILDIFLSNKENGLEFAEKLKHLFIPFIICTGYPQEDYSDKALELGAYAFFTKPLDKMAFAYKIKQFKEEQKNKLEKNFLPIKYRSFHIKIPLNKIKWLEIEGNYTSIVLDSGKQYIQKHSLKHYLEILNSDFLQVHRSYLVNKNYIQSVDLTKSTILLNGNESIPLGSKFKPKIIEYFN